MNNTEIILSLITTLSVSWAGIVTNFAIKAIKKSKNKVKYYQSAETQCKIANHVIKNSFYRDGGEVFR